MQNGVNAVIVMYIVYYDIITVLTNSLNIKLEAHV